MSHPESSDPDAKGKPHTSVQGPQAKCENPDCFEDEYAQLDRDTRNIHEKTKFREKVADPGLYEYKRDDMMIIEKRLEDNDRDLDKIYNNGLDFLTNIRARNNVRLVHRNEQEVLFDEEVNQLTDSKLAEWMAQMEVIQERFAEMNQQKDSPNLHEMLTNQRRRIAKVYANMDDVIQKHRDEFNRLGALYEESMFLQKSDCYCLYSRMEGHLNTMRRSYKEYLKLFQQTISSEWDTLHLTEHRKWEEMHKRNDENLDKKHNVVEEKRAFCDNEMARIRFDHMEETRAARIRLEKDEQSVFADMQALRVTCMMNSEKFDYNYQVLAKKGDENIMLRNQKKRQLAKMREQIVKLRKDIKDIQKDYDMSAAKCNREVIQFHMGFMDLDKRADRYAKINENKFTFAWKMNEDEANALLQRVLDVDKILFNQRLGLNWSQPENMPIKKEEMSSYKKAMKILYYHTPDIPDSDNADGNNPTDVEETAALPPPQPSKKSTLKLIPSISTMNEQMLADTRTIRLILRQIGLETEPLFGPKLKEILKPYICASKFHMILIDNIFTALGIENMQDVSTVIKHFLPFAWCTICQMRFHTEKTVERIAPTDTSESNSTRKRMTSTMDSDPKLTHSDSFIIGDYDTRSMGPSAYQTDISIHSLYRNLDDIRRSEQVCLRHQLAIEVGYVATALRNYIQSCLNQSARIIIGGIDGSIDSTPLADRLSCVRQTVPRLLSLDDVDMFWRRYREVFTEERKKLWAMLEKSQKDHLQVLQRRDKLDTECEYLRQQNRELKHMLAPHLKRKAIAECQLKHKHQQEQKAELRAKKRIN